MYIWHLTSVIVFRVQVKQSHCFAKVDRLHTIFATAEKETGRRKERFKERSRCFANNADKLRTNSESPAVPTWPHWNQGFWRSKVFSGQLIEVNYIEFTVKTINNFILQFQAIMDQLFLSFSSVSVNNFSELSAGVFSWLEECCKPQTLKDTVVRVLHRHNEHMRGQSSSS